MNDITADDFTALLDAPTPSGASIADLARRYLKMREEVDEAKRQQTDAQKKLDTMEFSLIAKLEEMGLKSVKLDGDGSTPDWLVTASEKTDYRLPGLEEPSYDDAMSWLLENGGESLIKQTVSWQSFNGFCHEAKKDGKPLPTGVKENRRKVVSVRKA